MYEPASSTFVSEKETGSAEELSVLHRKVRLSTDEYNRGWVESKEVRVVTRSTGGGFSCPRSLN